MTTVNVNLDCRNSSTNGGGYTNVNSSINTPYSFKFTGGTDGNGGVTEYTDDGSGQGTINVTVGGDPRYKIDTITISNDTHGDLSWAYGNDAHTQAVITDTNVDNETAYYSVTVRDTSANCTFLCDPPITNKPKPS